MPTGQLSAKALASEADSLCTAANEQLRTRPTPPDFGKDGPAAGRAQGERRLLPGQRRRAAGALRSAVAAPADLGRRRRLAGSFSSLYETSVVKDACQPRRARPLPGIPTSSSALAARQPGPAPGSGADVIGPRHEGLCRQRYRGITPDLSPTANRSGAADGRPASVPYEGLTLSSDQPRTTSACRSTRSRRSCRRGSLYIVIACHFSFLVLQRAWTYLPFFTVVVKRLIAPAQQRRDRHVELVSVALRASSSACRPAPRCCSPIGA